MKSIGLFVFVVFNFVFTDDFCSPSRAMASEMANDRENYIFLKGYFLPTIKGEEQLAKFRVSQTTDNSYIVGETYAVSSYGPFGNLCELYEIASSPLDNKACGKDNIRYLIAYKDMGDCLRLITPIFHDYGLVVNVGENRVMDEYMEYTSLSAFESNIGGNNEVNLNWTKIN